MGQARYGVPVVCVLAAVALIRARPAPAEDADEPDDEATTEPAPLRVATESR